MRSTELRLPFLVAFILWLGQEETLLTVKAPACDTAKTGTCVAPHPAVTCYAWGANGIVSGADSTYFGSP